VRADWLARAVTKAPLHADFLVVLGKPPDSKPPEEIKPLLSPTDAAVLVSRRDPDGEVKVAPRGASIPPRLPHPAVDKERQRLLQEHLAESIVSEKRGGVPIIPLDGLTYRRHNADPPLAVTFKAIDFEQRMLDDPPAKDMFVVGERMALWIKPNADAFVELVVTHKRGEKKIVELVVTDKRGEKKIGSGDVILSGRVKLLPETVEGRPKGVVMSLDDNEEQDNEEYTLYAYRAAALEEEKKPFPAGKVLHADKIHDRILHPLYQLDDNGCLKPPDANKMVKMTLRITTVRRGPKKD
jgi:hypothetical protein